jgi:hypothetical protein
VPTLRGRMVDRSRRLAPAGRMCTSKSRRESDIDNAMGPVISNRKCPAEAGLLGGGDPNDAKLELRCGVPHRMGWAPDARG